MFYDDLIARVIYLGVSMPMMKRYANTIMRSAITAQKNVKTYCDVHHYSSRPTERHTVKRVVMRTHSISGRVRSEIRAWNYPHRRTSSARRSKHFRQAHSKFLSLGIAKWPHLPQTNRPSATAVIALNSSPETQ